LRSLFTEYNRTQFSKASSTFDYGNAYPSNWTYEFKHKLDSLKAGVNVRFKTAAKVSLAPAAMDIRKLPLPGEVAPQSGVGGASPKPLLPH